MDPPDDGPDFDGFDDADLRKSISDLESAMSDEDISRKWRRRGESMLRAMIDEARNRGLLRT